jgi:hypothetical protein
MCLGMLVETLSTETVSVEMPIIQVETRTRARLGREMAGVVEQPYDCLPEQVNGCPQFTINECKKHCKSIKYHNSKSSFE